MMRNIRNILIGLIIIGFVSCLGIKSLDKADYIGNFTEKHYDFFESFRHNQLADFYYELPFDLKFGGIRPFPFDSIGEKDYSWLRKPENLKIAFNAFSTVGLEKFVSKEKYFEKNTDWCCDTDWENKSLNEIVTGFINSDTASNGQDYYSKFWQRRRLENNLTVTYEIFVQIDRFYNHGDQHVIYQQRDSVLAGLLDFDTKLLNSDSAQYFQIALDYFDYLKSVGLDYSAFKIIFHNKKLKMPKVMMDSLLLSVKHDTISENEWLNLNDNRDGWITWIWYRDPGKYYGP